MTVYVKELLAQLVERYGKMPIDELGKKLYEIGVIDHTLCKVLAIRRDVEKSVKGGEKKVNAMWNASEKFCCTYEYVRKCVYYYTDVNMN